MGTGCEVHDVAGLCGAAGLCGGDGLRGAVGVRGAAEARGVVADKRDAGVVCTEYDEVVASLEAHGGRHEVCEAAAEPGGSGELWCGFGVNAVLGGGGFDAAGGGVRALLVCCEQPF